MLQTKHCARLRRRVGGGRVAYLVVGFDIELNLLAGEGSYSSDMSVSIHVCSCSNSKLFCLFGVLDLHVERCASILGGQCL